MFSRKAEICLFCCIATAVGTPQVQFVGVVCQEGNTLCYYFATCSGYSTTLQPSVDGQHIHSHNTPDLGLFVTETDDTTNSFLQGSVLVSYVQEGKKFDAMIIAFRDILSNLTVTCYGNTNEEDTSNFSTDRVLTPTQRVVNETRVDYFTMEDATPDGGRVVVLMCSAESGVESWSFNGYNLNVEAERNVIFQRRHRDGANESYIKAMVLEYGDELQTLVVFLSGQETADITCRSREFTKVVVQISAVTVNPATETTSRETSVNSTDISDDSDDGGSSSVGVIVGTVAAVVVITIIISLVVFIAMKCLQQYRPYKTFC